MHIALLQSYCATSRQFYAFRVSAIAKCEATVTCTSRSGYREEPRQWFIKILMYTYTYIYCPTDGERRRCVKVFVERNKRLRDSDSNDCNKNQ